jgi:hypothetical protein
MQPMNLAITLIPILALLSLILLSMLFTTLRAARLSELKAKQEKARQRILQTDAQLHESLITDLLGGKPVAETLQGFARHRAALLPGLRLEEPAAWDTEVLDQYAREQLASKTAEINRRLGTATLIGVALVVGTSVTTGVVLYHFAPGSAAPVGAPVQFLADPAEPTKAAAPSDLSPPLPPTTDASPPASPSNDAADSIDADLSA